MVLIADEHVESTGRWVRVPRCPPGSGRYQVPRRVVPCPLRAPQTMQRRACVHEGRWCWCLSVGHSAVYDRLSVCHEGRYRHRVRGARRARRARRVVGRAESMVESSKGRWSMVRSIDVELVDVESMGWSIDGLGSWSVPRWVGGVSRRGGRTMMMMS